MKNYIPDRVASMKEYVPDTSSPRIKLDANECPFELPAALNKEMIAALSHELSNVNRYPDPEMKDMLSAYAEHIGVSSDLIVAGDGSDELINLIINTFLCDGGKILICEPDFSMYRFYCELAGVDTFIYRKRNGMRIATDELIEIISREKIKLVMFSNPCNPTGVLEPASEIRRLLSSTDALVVVDEAYMEFAREDNSVISAINEFENLIVLKTVSKLGLAGLRCGFAIGCHRLISALKKTKSPYNMNTLTQLAVTAAMRNFDGISENIKKIKNAVRRLYDSIKPLEAAGGFEVDISDTNFIYLRFNDRQNGEAVQRELHRRGIAVRVMNGHLRITAGTDAENSELVKELTDILKKG